MSTIPSLTPLTPIGTEEVYVTDGLTNKRVTLNAIAALAVDTNTGILNVVEDTTPQLGGSLDTNTFDINLGADDGIFPTVAPTSDHNASGNKATLTAGESLVFGDVCYIKSDGKAWKADVDGAAPAERGLLIALATILADAPGVFSLPGSFIRDDTWAWTVGNPIYLSDTAGALTQTAPTPAIVMGIATHADRMYFYPTIQDAASGGGGGGKLLQVAYGAYASQTTHTSTYANTGLSASITVSAADSNVLIFVSQNVGENGYAFHADLQIMRDTTVVKEFKKAFFDEDGVTFATADNVALNAIDITPGIGTYTYKTQCKEVSGDVRTQYTGGATSTIILMEIGA
jgi:hypothetical protein